MSRFDDLAERIEHLVLRHEELKRTHALLEQQLGSVSSERDSLRSRLAAARARIDALLDRLPVDPEAASGAVATAKPGGLPEQPQAQAQPQALPPVDATDRDAA
jgi:cell division protein ZapB